MKNFRELRVWEAAHRLTLTVYAATRTFPASERFGLASQMRCASASIGANIAEGCSCDTEADFARFLSVALGSATELEYHLLLSRDLQLLEADPHKSMESALIQVKRQLHALHSRLKRYN